MKKYLHPKFLPILVSAASVIGLLLRLWTMGKGPDAEGLYAPQPFAWTLLWIVTILALGAVVLLSAKLKNPGRYSDNFPASPVGAAGHIVAALGIMMSGLRILTTASNLMASLTGILGVGSAVCLLLLGFARYQGKKTSFLLHAIPCLFFALRIFLLCRAWSNETQIGTFLFPFLSSICVMLASYHLACFDVNLGKRRVSLFWSLSGVYFSLLALPGCSEPVFYIGMAAWLLTNLCSLKPLKARKPQSAPEVAPEIAPEAPAPEAPAPESEDSTSAPEPALREDMSYDELLQWLDKE